MSVKESLRRGLCYILSFILSAQTPIYAASSIIVDESASSANQAILDTAHNDVSIVNISGDLSAAGVSHNKFTKFDIGSEGAVLNNSTEFGMSVLTGDALYNNPLLTGGAAKVIITEVTGGGASNLLGYTEVFGEQADYIFANPKGISCNGCGFINVDRLSMITGSSDSVNGEIAGFNIGDGVLSIGSGGLDASGTSAAELVTKIADITGNIVAGNELNIKTGNKYYDYTTGNISSNQDTSSDSNAPEGGAIFGVDASEFGSMYAGKIKIIATEAGFGVRSGANMISSVSDVTITAEGDIIYTNIVAEGDVGLASNQDIEQLGQTYSKGDVHIAAQNDITLSGDYLYGEEVVISAVNDVAVESGIYGFENAEILGRDISISENGEVISKQGSVGELSITATNDITNSGVIASVSKLNLSGNKITNEHELYAADKLEVIADDLVNEGVIISDNNLSIESGVIDNGGRLVSQDVLTITAEEITSDTIYSIGVANIVSDNLTNNNIIQSDETLNITASGVSNSGVVLAGSALNITSDLLSNTGSVYATGTVDIESNNLTNDNLIQSDEALNITASEVSNSGVVLTGSALNIISDLLSNTGAISAFGSSDINIDEIDNDSGRVLLLGSENNITASVFNNSNTRSDESEEEDEALDLDRGLIVTGDLSGEIGAINNDSGNIYINGAANLDTLNNDNGFVHLATGMIGQLDQVLHNENGEIEIGNEGYVQIHTSGIDGEGGIIGGYGSLSILSGANELSLDGDISVGGLFSISHYLAGDDSASEASFLSVINGGNLYGAEGVYISASDLANSGNLISGVDIGLDVSGDITNTGGIYAADSLYSESAEFINQGEMISGRDMIIQAEDGLDNSQVLDSVQAASDLERRIVAGGDFVYDGNILNNSGGELLAYGETYVKNLQNEEGYFYSGEGGVVDNIEIKYADVGTFEEDGSVKSEYFDIIKNYQSGGEYGEPNRDPGGEWEAEALEWYGGGMIYNRGGVIESGSGVLTLQGRDLDYNDDGQIIGEGGVSLEMDNSTHVARGDISVGGLFAISRYIRDDNLEQTFYFSNEAELYGGGGFYMEGTSMYNYGSVLSGADMVIKGTLSNAEDAAIYSQGDLSIISSGNITNQTGAIIQSDQNLYIGGEDGERAKYIINEFANIKAAGDITMHAQYIQNKGADGSSGALIEAGDNIVMTAENDVMNNRYGAIKSGAALDIEAANFYNENEVISGGDMILKIEESLNNRSYEDYHEAKLLSYGDMSLTGQDGANVADINNRQSRIASQGNMLIAVDNLENEGRDFALGSVQTGYVDTGFWANYNTVVSGYETLTGSNIYTDYAEILSGGSMILSGNSLTNSGGRIYADGSLSQSMNGIVRNDYITTHSVTLNTDYHTHWRTGNWRGHTDHHQYTSVADRDYTYNSNDGSEIISGGHGEYLDDFESTHFGSESANTVIGVGDSVSMPGLLDPTSGTVESESAAGYTIPDMSGYQSGLGVIAQNFADLKEGSLDVKRQAAKDTGKLELAVMDQDVVSSAVMESSLEQKVDIQPIFTDSGNLDLAVIDGDVFGSSLIESSIEEKPDITQIFTDAGLKVETQEDGRIDLALEELGRYETDYAYLDDGSLDDELFKRSIIEEFMKDSYREYTEEEQAFMQDQLDQQEAERKELTQKAIDQHFASLDRDIKIDKFSHNDVEQSFNKYPQYSYVPANLDNMFTGLDASGLTIIAKNIISKGGEISSSEGDLALISEENIELENTQLASGGSSDIIAGGDISITKSDDYSISNTELRNFVGADPRVRPDPSENSVGTTIANTNSFTIPDTATNLIDDLTFNSESDIQIASGGDLTIDTDYLNSGGSIYLDAAGDLTNSNHEINASDDVVMSASNIYNKHIEGGNPTKIIAGDIAYLNSAGDIENEGAEIAAGSLAYLNAGGDITNKSTVATTVSGNNVESELSKGSITSDDMLVLNAGGNIINEGADITSTGDMSIIAGGDIDISTTEVYNREYQTFSGGHSDTKTWTQEQSQITSGGNLAIASGGAIGITGSNLSATGDLDIEAADGINITAAENKRDYKYHWQSKKKWGSRKYVDKTEITTEVVESNLSGDNINISNTGTGDITLTAAQLAAVNEINITAADGDVNIENGYDSSYKEEVTRKTNGWKGAMIGVAAGIMTGGATLVASVTAGQVFANNDKRKKTEEDTEYTVVSSNLTAGGDININNVGATTAVARNNNINISASNLTSDSGNITLTADKDINLNIAKDISSHTVKEEGESLVWFRNHDRGSYDETIRESSIIASNGTTTLTANDNINIDVGADPRVRPSFNNLNGNVTYNEVTESHDKWNEETEGLTEVGSAVVAVATAVATAGAGAALMSAAGGSAAGAAAAAAAGTATVAQGMAVATVTASVSAAASQVAVSTVNNQGDLGQVMDDLDQGEFYEGVAVAGVTAGATSGLTSAVSSLNSIPQGAISNSVRDSIISSAVESSINGDSFSESLESAALNAAVSTGTKALAGKIGDLAHPTDEYGNPTTPKISKPTQLALHAVVGCASGAAISGSCGGGAAGAVAGEVIAEGTYGSGFSKESSLKFAEIGSAIAGGIVGGDADSVYAGSKAGRNSAENNFWRHEMIDEHMSQRYLEGSISAGEYQSYKDQEVENAKMGLNLIGSMAAPAVLSGGALLAIHGTSSALNGGWGSYISGGDAGNIAVSAGSGLVAGVMVGKFLPQFGKGYLGYSLGNGLSGGVGGATGAGITTQIVNPNATKFEYMNNSLKGFSVGFASGFVMGPISYSGRRYAPISSNFAASMYGLQVDSLTAILASEYDFLNKN